MFLNDRVVLVIDDEPNLRLAYGRMIERAGGTAICVGTLSEGSRMLDSVKIDVAVIDWFLPNGSGLEMIGTLSTLRPGLGCVLITGFDVDIAGVTLPVVPLTKPFDMARLIEAIARADRAASDTLPPSPNVA